MDAENLRNISLILKVASMFLLIIALALPWISIKGTENEPVLSVGEFTVNKATANCFGAVSTDITLETESSLLTIKVSPLSVIGALEVIILLALAATSAYWFYLKVMIVSKKRIQYDKLFTYDLLLSIFAIALPLITIALYPSFKLHYALYAKRGAINKLIREDEKPLYNFPAVALGPGPILALIAGILLSISALLYGYASNKDLL